MSISSEEVTMDKNDAILQEMGLSISDEEVKYLEVITDIAAEITTYRALNNLSQEELARKLNKKQSYVSKLESGENNLTIKKLSEISVLLEGDLHVSLGIADYQDEIEKYELFFDLDESIDVYESDYSFDFDTNDLNLSDEDKKEALAA